MLLRPGYMLHTLDVEHNRGGDSGIAAIAAIALGLIVSEKDLFEGGDEGEEQMELPPDVLASIAKRSNSRQRTTPST